MVTIILSYPTSPSDGVACGVGRTYLIAEERALDMFAERVEGNRNPTDEDRQHLRDQIARGVLLAVCFG